MGKQAQIKHAEPGQEGKRLTTEGSVGNAGPGPHGHANALSGPRREGRISENFGQQITGLADFRPTKEAVIYQLRVFSNIKPLYPGEKVKGIRGKACCLLKVGKEK